MKKETEEKLNKITSITAQIVKLEKELEDLLEPKAALPAGFSINEEVLAIIKAVAPKSITRKRIIDSVQNEYPDYNLDNKRIASSLAYLKNTKKVIDLISRGEYRLKIETTDPEQAPQVVKEDISF